MTNRSHEILPVGEQPNTEAVSIRLRNVVFQPAASPFRLEIPRFEVGAGSRVAITGRSGAGKTTLLNLISGRLRPESGQLSILGHDLASLSESEREAFRLEKIGIVFQDFRLIDYLTVADNLQLTTLLSGYRSTAPAASRVEQIATQLGISRLLKRYPHRLSQGERQRVAIGRALFNDPSLILADEPTGNLDAATAEQTLDYLIEAAESCKSTLLVVTHDSSQLARFDQAVSMAELCGEPTNR